MSATIPRQVVHARRIAGMILVLSALGTVIMLVILAGWWSTRPPSVTGAVGTPSNTAAVPATQPPVFQSPAIQPPISPEIALPQQADGDHQQVEILVGYWVPQLSARAVGLAADGIAYGYAEILSHFNWTREIHGSRVRDNASG